MVGNSLGFLAEKSTKNQIIQVLSEQWPLSVKEIHNQLVKQHSFSGSYQAVFKAIKEMQGNGILNEFNHQYSIETNWIANTKKHLENIEKTSKTLNVNELTAKKNNVL